jgi:chromosomal replication initiator protein
MGSLKGKIKSEVSIDWNKIAEKFIYNYGDAVYNSWIKPLSIIEHDQSYVTLAAPNRFVKDWVKSNYLDSLTEYFREFNNNIIKLDIIVSTNNKGASFGEFQNPQNDNSQDKRNVSSLTNINSKGNSNSINLKAAGNLSLNKKQNFESFISSNTNRLAFYTTQKIAEAIISNDDEQIEGYSPLFISGAVGCGKTHLLNSIANRVKKADPSKNIVFLSAEKFMFKFIKSLQENNIISFKEEVRSADILLIDDIHFLSGKTNVQDEFMHCIDHIMHNNGKIIIAGDRNPAELDRIENRLKSRLSGGLVANIEKPDLELRTKIIEQKSQDLSLKLDEDSILAVANKLTYNIREIIAFLNRLKARKEAFGRAINFEDIRAILGNEFVESREITLDQIKKIVAKKFSVSVTDIDSKKRNAEIANARQIGMYMVKKYTSKSLPEIGRNFGDRNHATVIHAIKTVDNKSSKSADFASLIREVEAMIAS